ncbi:MAG TPA: sulfotransferase [Caulobacteraceae bacterium]|jgi:Flp pilus assembly protein TadD|nr:sulfotransferase [Caulobacteraceae bacterium]
MRNALSAGRLDEAVALADVAVCEAPGQSMVVRLVAETMERSGRGREGARLLARAIERTPDDAMLLVGLGGRLIALGRSGDAIRMFEAAIRADPTSAEAHYALAKTLANDSDFEGARVSFQRALEILPAYADARGAFASLLARSGDADEARGHAERALADAPGQVDAALALSLVDLRARRFAEAEMRARDLMRSPGIDTHSRALATGLLADALDGQDRTAAAYLSYVAANELFRQQVSADYPAASRAYQDNLDRLTKTFAHADPADWSGAPVSPSEAVAQTHVFLVGFPRSGTTLLETVLAAHPKVVTLEEQPTLDAAEAAYLAAPGGVEQLARLDAEAAERFRADYWRRVRASGVEPAGKTFIDKLPLNTPKLPAIAKLFPRAKILFARRDPRDVVLSCFRRSFLPNIATYSMLSPKGSAELYAAVMRLADVYRRVLPLALREVRYETLVENFEEEARGVVAFLDLEWDEAVLDFAARAQGRLINTPSAAQVRRGVYRDGAGQWRRYRDQIASVLPILEPWIAPHGYDQGEQ